MSKILTLEYLHGLHACAPQVDLFQKLFGYRVEVTEEACFEVYDQFDFEWILREHHRLSYNEFPSFLRQYTTSYDDLEAAFVERRKWSDKKWDLENKPNWFYRCVTNYAKKRLDFVCRQYNEAQQQILDYREVHAQELARIFAITYLNPT